MVFILWLWGQGSGPCFVGQQPNLACCRSMARHNGVGKYSVTQHAERPQVYGFNYSMVVWTGEVVADGDLVEPYDVAGLKAICAKCVA